MCLASTFRMTSKRKRCKEQVEKRAVKQGEGEGKEGKKWHQTRKFRGGRHKTKRRVRIAHKRETEYAPGSVLRVCDECTTSLPKHTARINFFEGSPGARGKGRRCFVGLRRENTCSTACCPPVLRRSTDVRLQLQSTGAPDAPCTFELCVQRLGVWEAALPR